MTVSNEDREAAGQMLSLGEIEALPPGAIVRTADGRPWVSMRTDGLSQLDWHWSCPNDDAAAGDDWVAGQGAALVGAVPHTPAADRLVSYGWGPRPAVSRAWIEESIDCCGATAIIEGLANTGIEVTE